jgi:hypothetical protein
MLPIDAIAARAGVSRTLAKNALRQAARLGLLSIDERRRPGRPNLTNVVRIIARDWLAWIKRGPKQGGVRNLTSTDTNLYRKEEERAERTSTNEKRPRSGAVERRSRAM